MCCVTKSYSTASPRKGRCNRGSPTSSLNNSLNAAVPAKLRLDRGRITAEENVKPSDTPEQGDSDGLADGKKGSSEILWSNHAIAKLRSGKRNHLASVAGRQSAEDSSTESLITRTEPSMFIKLQPCV